MDARLRVLGLPTNVYAIGDCAAVAPSQLVDIVDTLYDVSTKT